MNINAPLHLNKTKKTTLKRVEHLSRGTYIV